MSQRDWKFLALAASVAFALHALLGLFTGAGAEAETQAILAVWLLLLVRR